MTEKTNGLSKRERTAKARERVLRVAVRRGYITDGQARLVGKWAQAWYHCHVMRKMGLLKYAGYSRWEPTKKGLKWLGEHTDA
jgi:hypothetical protein